jgi:shikimate kinase
MIDRQIVIIGFMGTGKTTVARELARKLRCSAVDLDELITTQNGRRPGKIIEQDGEDTFREIETELLREIIEKETARIVAVGGGAWTIAANRELIAAGGAFTVWLDAPFELCWERIEAGREGRPLARSRELAQRLYVERRPIYQTAAARVLISAGESVSETATKILKALRDA